MNFQEKRRFPRAQVLKNLAGLAPELQAQVSWPNHEICEVMDLSYKGMAVRRPGMFPINVQQKVAIAVELGGQLSFTVQARIAWCNMDWVGLEFSSLPPEGHQSMREFLDAKLVGSSLKPVERVFIHGRESFHYWYQGSSQTHVYVWMNASEQVERVLVDLDGEAAEFSRGQKRLRLGRVERRALLVLSQMDKPGLPMEEFVRSLLLGA